MTTYVDVETSPEALKEDEELIEAVNEVLEVVSEAVQQEIRTEIDDLSSYLHALLQRFLPRIVAYQTTPGLLQTDCEKLGIFLLILTVAVWWLAPYHSKSPGIRRTVSDTLDESSDTEILLEEEEMEFEKIWELELQKANYRRLILPPTCRGKAKRPRPKVDSPKTVRSSEDDPSLRLQEYFRQVWIFLQSILWYDYGLAVRQLGFWAWNIRQVRSQNRVTNLDDSQTSIKPLFHETDSTKPATRTPLETSEEEEEEDEDTTPHVVADLDDESSVRMPDKNGYVVGEDLLEDPKRCTPLLVLVNSRSGPQQGHLLITQLRRLLNPVQVYDLADGDPTPVLQSFTVFSRLRLLVCGGDGTVSWILDSLERIGKARPPLAILPLGTGNDLARIHGWGGGYNNESLITILEQISESYASLLDRWNVEITDKKQTITKGCFNYLGVGADAQAALHVHHLRASRPEWFFSRLVNKAMYGVFGAEDIIKASNVNVRREVKLFADGIEVPLPVDSQGIILLNIDAYAGGVPLWSHGTRVTEARRSQSQNDVRRSHQRRRLESMDRVDSMDDFGHVMSDEERYERVTACDRPSSCQDGYLDVVSIRGAFHLGQIKVGLSNAQRLCQCREAKITIRNQVAVQVDGEPWRQRGCTISITRKKEPAVMLHRSADDGGVETEMSKLLEWAEERQMIDSQVHSILMKEFSRRIESKTRQRRVRAQDDNFMSTLKKAISSGAMVGMGTGVGGSQHGPVLGGIAF